MASKQVAHNVTGDFGGLKQAVNIVSKALYVVKTGQNYLPSRRFQFVFILSHTQVCSLSKFNYSFIWL